METPIPNRPPHGEPPGLAQLYHALTLAYWNTHIHEIKQTQHSIIFQTHHNEKPAEHSNLSPAQYDAPADSDLSI